jgi:2-C-methyl-D-erythritol 2,4-cyclodiphosphate synthase
MDALLGAVADGDIGQHFPDTDAVWKDARSLDLLACVGERLRSLRASVVNVDVTVMAERPKLAPYLPAMRANVGDALGIPVNRVSLKATTVERMGAIGREEGVAALAVATVDQEDEE